MCEDRPHAVQAGGQNVVQTMSEANVSSRYSLDRVAGL